MKEKDERRQKLTFLYDDGGRSKYYKAQNVDDCVVRAIAIASRRDYKEVYQEIRKQVGYSPRNGVYRRDLKSLLPKMGGRWVSCMAIGSGCKTHLSADEIPMDKRIVCSLSKHVVAVVNGIIRDTYDSSRDGNRCVYGYWIFD